MGRSVSVPRNAAYAAYQALSDECDGDDFSWLVDDLRSVLKSAFPSVSESDRWAGREGGRSTIQAVTKFEHRCARAGGEVETDPDRFASGQRDGSEEHAQGNAAD